MVAIVCVLVCARDQLWTTGSEGGEIPFPTNIIEVIGFLFTQVTGGSKICAK
jgi:hypothetical protein